MFFHKDTPLSEIQSWIDKQLPPVYNTAKNGIEINIFAHKNTRSTEQNRFLMLICTAIARLHHETGYCCPGLQPWAMQPKILKEYFKSRFGIERSSKLSTAEFTKFIDYIQTTMVEETNGEYEILTTDFQYIESLIGEL